MAAPNASALSVTCRAVADFVKDELTGDVNVMIGPPADAAPGETDTDQRLNLFFYRIEPSGFYPDHGPHDPFLIRLFCLVTAFSVAEAAASEEGTGGQISAGEIDLRVLGEVVRIFHENPIFGPITIDSIPTTLQLIARALESEEINHIWVTQGDVAYRPSVAYEMALSPIVPNAPKPSQRLVGALGLETRGQLDRDTPFAGSAAAFPVAERTVATNNEGWAPAICFVEADQCQQALLFETGNPVPAGFTPAVWIAGTADAAASLVWEAWGNRGWEPVSSTATTIPDQSGSSNVTPEVLDPEVAPDAQTVPAALPASGPGQWTLYAERTYTRAADGVAVTVRSNPLLLTVVA